MLPLIFLAGMAVLLGTSTWLDTQVREKVFFARFEQEVMETQQATLRTLVDLETQRLGRIVQVNQAIHRINEVTQHASSTAEECAGAAQELRSHSSRLKTAATGLSHLAR